MKAQRYEMKNGTIVLSKAGRDSGRLFIVVGRVDENFVLIADGKLRKVDTPKKKKLKHLKELGFDREVARLCDGELTNRILKKQLSLYEQSESENLA